MARSCVLGIRVRSSLEIDAVLLEDIAVARSIDGSALIRDRVFRVLSIEFRRDWRDMRHSSVGKNGRKNAHV
jgi:hypothetical protein